MVNTTKNLLLTSDNTFDLHIWVERIAHERPSVERQALIEACTLATHVHHRQTRASGEPYVLHVITVADILAQLGMDTDVLIAAILHEVVEDKEVRLEEIQNCFGSVVSRLVDGVARMKLIEELNDHHPQEENQIESLRKMILAMVEDVRVVLIKLADRLDNMRTLRYLPEPKRQRIAQETLDIFAPLANRLGIWQIKWELEDLSLRYLQPQTYQQMAQLLDERRIDRERYIEHIVTQLKQALSQVGIQAEVSGRPKHIYSIWRKMQRKRLDFDQIFDVRAVRVLVNSVTECYMTLGIIHSQWQPIPGKFDDYIANPKNNNYQSLHTTVAGPEQKIFEVQIRTYGMHHHAELGVASHWRYKEGATQYDKSFEHKIAWLRQILLWKDEENNAGDFIDRFKSEIFEDRVYVLSPQGKIIDLPQGATPLDFAYHIHTGLGHCCRGAKVNNRIVPLTYMLKSGDQVEILTSKEEKPSRDWLIPHIGYLKTSRARAKVRQWLKKQDIKQHISDGRLLLDRELRRLNIKDYNLEQLAQELEMKTVEELLAALGRGDISMTHIANLFDEQVLAKKKFPIITKPRYSGGKVYIKGVGGLLTQIARCCRPVPYDAIVGYISKMRGVVVHRRDCPNALRWQEEGNERLVEVEWQRQLLGQENFVYPVDIQVLAYDRPGLLRDISSIAANEKINIISANTLTDKVDNCAKMIFTVEVNNLDQLSRALAQIDNLANVMRVWRKT